MQTFINTWTKTNDKYNEYKVDSAPIYQNGEYAIYKLHKDSHLYTYKNVAISNLVGVNKFLVDSLVLNERPTDGHKYQYDRILELIEKCKAEGLIKDTAKLLIIDNNSPLSTQLFKKTASLYSLVEFEEFEKGEIIRHKATGQYFVVMPQRKYDNYHKEALQDLFNYYCGTYNFSHINR